MCGVFGVIANEPVDTQLFQDLAVANRDRGSRGEGWLIRYEGKTDPETIKFDPATLETDHLISILDGYPKPPRVLLGHCLAPTNGDAVSPERMHPFQWRDFAFAHNGILLDYRKWVTWRGNLPDVDSCYMFGGIQTKIDDKMSIEAAIEYVATTMSGQFACWLYHKPTGVTYLWRNMSPSYVSSEIERFVFSSVQTAVTDLLLPEGTVFKIVPARPRLNKVGTFKVNSIYEVL